MKNRIVTLVAALGLAMTLSGCKSDCSVSCERYQECVSANLNVDRCTDQCNSRSEDDKNFATRAEDCAKCVEDKTCSEANSRCWDECLPVIDD
ncbi:hypothetical protein [Archangium lipolyticum]|uniref:hypothetical protein n=1 Tax=Archangium lipolyticum TaxID=2970465 RepID=UPI002149CCB8|nr:hypothetical protein [Archangium lipolyticum]